MLAWVPRYGYAAIAGLLAASIVMPVPDDALLLAAGSLVSRGELALVPAIAAGTLGSACGMTVSYGLGRWLGVRLVRRFGRLIHLDAARLDAARAWYLRWGRLSLFGGYFVPGFRHVAAFLAGSSGLSWPAFAASGYAGGLAWSTAMVGVGYVVGAEWAHASARVHRALEGGLALAAIVLVVAVVIVRRRRGAPPPSTPRDASKGAPP
jgi:membrane protein DedA with SNARE-associated domain